MNQSKRGFTIVEIAIVISIVAVIMTIITVTFNRVQIESRDRKRANDMTLFATSLDTYFREKGEYPPICTSSCPPSVSWNTAAFALDRWTDSWGQSQILHDLPSDFKDPKNSVTSAIGVNTNDSDAAAYPYLYGYMGGFYNSSGNTVNYTNYAGYTRASGSIYRCSLQWQLPASDSYGAYAISYFSESKDQLMIFIGPNGVKPSLSGTSTPGKCAVQQL